MSDVKLMPVYLDLCFAIVKILTIVVAGGAVHKNRKMEEGWAA